MKVSSVNKEEYGELEAVVVGDPARRVLKSIGVSPTITKWSGNYPVRPGKRLHLRIRIPHEGTSLYVDAYLTVKEVFKDPKGGFTGFEGEWIRASSVGDVEPLKAFLKGYLKVEGGFVQVLKPENEHEVPVYSYSFVKGKDSEGAFVEEERSSNEENEGIPEEKEETSDAQDIQENKAPHSEEKPEGERGEKPKWPTRIYATIPMVYIWEGKRINGTAVKLKPEGLRIDTQEFIPHLYSPVQIELPVSVSGKSGKLVLNATVSLVKQSKSGKGGQFEVKFSLKNLPAMLQGYRDLIRELQESMGPG